MFSWNGQNLTLSPNLLPFTGIALTPVAKVSFACFYVCVMHAVTASKNKHEILLSQSITKYPNRLKTQEAVSSSWFVGRNSNTIPQNTRDLHTHACAHTHAHSHTHIRQNMFVCLNTGHASPMSELCPAADVDVKWSSNDGSFGNKSVISILPIRCYCSNLYFTGNIWKL